MSERKSVRPLVTFATVVGGLLVAGLFIPTIATMPNSATVVVNDSLGEYYGPNCLPLSQSIMDSLGKLSDEELQEEAEPAFLAAGLRPTTAGEARALDYEPAGACLRIRAFDETYRSLTGFILERIGVLEPPRRSRWNEDGTWNW